MQALGTLRDKQQVTQQELADAIGVTRQLISAIESGRANPSLNTLIKISRYFSIPIDELLNPPDQKPTG